jgi:hypothetical protein
MSKDEQDNRSRQESAALDKFGPGGEFGPIDDRNEYEQRLNSLPTCASTSPNRRWIFRRLSSRGWEVFPNFQRQIAFAP